MTTAYHRALATPGAVRFVPAAFLGRLPIAMVSVGTVLFVHAETGSYGIGGAVAAAGAVGEALLAPRLGRALDRFGQARVLLVCLCCHLAAMATLTVAVAAGAPRPVWFAAAAVAGGSLPPVAACSRARWSARLGGDELLGTALALEAALDELVFVLGPVLVTLLAVLVAPVAGLVAAMAFLTVGTSALVSLRDSDPGPRDEETTARPHMLRNHGTRTLLVVFFCIGIAFGGVDVSMVAFAREEGLAAVGGLLLGMFATGSAVSGLIYGAREHSRPLPDRFRRAASLMAVGMALPLAGLAVPLMIPLALLAGATSSPTLITGNALVERMVGAGARTEGFTWLTMAVVSGIAVGTPVAGALVDAGGSHRGLLVTAASGVFIGLSAVVGGRAVGCGRGPGSPASRAVTG
ncbi:arabinose efflux permease family protein [Frankia sp. EI5c]|uniref:MFS transporter n=1 Tax=Frankia sp. EI5c TaxID=683316 RepID=UPI0007C353E7|nr:MFS transporter [Frankia sp. EI5c]OAA28585.1 arabinose efflux permease family protein [Frankia sp. EI5c]